MMQSIARIRQLVERAIEPGRLLEAVDGQIIIAAVDTIVAEHNRRTAELVLANNEAVEKRRAAEHEAEIWQSSAHVMAEAHHVEHHARQAIADELQRVRAGQPDGHARAPLTLLEDRRE